MAQPQPAGLSKEALCKCPVLGEGAAPAAWINEQSSSLFICLFFRKVSSEDLNCIHVKCIHGKKGRKKTIVQILGKALKLIGLL